MCHWWSIWNKQIRNTSSYLQCFIKSAVVTPCVKYLKRDLNPFHPYWECMPLLTQCCLQGKRRNKEFALVCWSKTVCPEQIFYVYLSVCKPLWVSMLWLYTCMKYCNTLGSRLAFLNTFPHYFFWNCAKMWEKYTFQMKTLAARHKKSIFFTHEHLVCSSHSSPTG